MAGCFWQGWGRADGSHRVGLKSPINFLLFFIPQFPSASCGSRPQVVLHVQNGNRIPVAGQLHHRQRKLYLTWQDFSSVHPTPGLHSPARLAVPAAPGLQDRLGDPRWRSASRSLPSSLPRTRAWVQALTRGAARGRLAWSIQVSVLSSGTCGAAGSVWAYIQVCTRSSPGIGRDGSGPEMLWQAVSACAMASTVSSSAPSTVIRVRPGCSR